ncbi:MAG: proline racemase family protein, partial [Actinomycetota bacterium]
SCLPQLTEAGRAVQQQLDAAGAAQHPADGRLSGIYGVTLYEDLPGEGAEGALADGTAGGGKLRQRNVTVFGNGQIDRSPCGSGTSARLALLAADGLADGQVLVHESIIGTQFEARVSAAVQEGGRDAVETEITGSAYLTGLHQFVLDPADPLGTGYLLG